jgi:hypothetical protein
MLNLNIDKSITKARIRTSIFYLISSAFFLTCFWCIGHYYLFGYTLDLGSLNVPRIRYVYFLFFWMFFGAIASVFFALFIRSFSNYPPIDISFKKIISLSDKYWICAGCLLAFMIAAIIRINVLQNSPLTDDEASYKYMGELLAAGRLTGESHDFKLFFDNIFMINDGRVYSHFFIGWPLFMVPGVWFGVPGFINSLYSALTVIPLYSVFRRLIGNEYAKLGILIYLSSPMLMVSAATALSQTTCFLMLTTLIWSYLRSIDENAPFWTHSLVATFFGLAFFIRPLSTLGVGLPVMVLWLFSLRDSNDKNKSLLWFGLPAIVLAAAFFYVNYAQNGSILKTAYYKYIEYSQENQFRFSIWSEESVNRGLFRDFSVVSSIAASAIAFVRLHFAAFGWPFIVFLCFARLRNAKLGWSALIGFFLVNIFTMDSGFDSYGPVHYFEAILPLMILVLAGTKGLSDSLSRLDEKRICSRKLKPFAVSLCLAMITVSCFGYVPVRLGTLYKMCKNISIPSHLIEEKGIENVVVFATRPFVDQRAIAPTRHFVFFRPNSDPDFEDSIIWANHISIERDKNLISEAFPEREGYVLVHTGVGKLLLLPLKDLAPNAIPDG